MAGRFPFLCYTEFEICMYGINRHVVFGRLLNLAVSLVILEPGLSLNETSHPPPQATGAIGFHILQPFIDGIVRFGAEITYMTN